MAELNPCVGIAPPGNAGYELRGANRAVFASREHEVVDAGPAECVSGDTVIEGDGHTIKWLCDHDIAPRVQTLYGPRQAGVPFLKGSDWLYEITTTDGRKFKATARHIVLTCGGFCFVESLSSGVCLVGYDAFHLLNHAIVSSVRRTDYDDFYDLTVPDADHYFAHGLIHHNTGKTFACCLKVHVTCELIPKTQVLMARKTFNALVGTVVKTYERIVEGRGVEAFGGRNPTRFIYQNGSTVWLGGMDNPDSCLSAERDLIYCNQSEEFTRDDWEKLTTRCTGRGGVLKYPQLIGDANPGAARHWILERARAGALRLLHSTHRDNPSLYDRNGKITDQGKQTMAILETLTGARKLRLLRGIWANAEGAVYDIFNSDQDHGHVCERSYDEMVAFYLAVDFGFTDPCAILLVGADEDRRLHVFKEFYQTGLVPNAVVKKAVEFNKVNEEFVCEVAACDEARADMIEAMKLDGINAVGVKKGPNSIKEGIGMVQDRLAIVKGDISPRWPDGRPRLTVSSFCVNTISEFESYVWSKNKEGASRDTPVDANNHALDALRYLVMQLTTGTGAFTSSSTIHLPTPTVGADIRPRFVPRRFVPTRR